MVWLLRWRCCGGGRWRCRGSQTAAPRSGVTASIGGERGYCSSLLLCFLSSSFNSFFPFVGSFSPSSLFFLFLVHSLSLVHSLHFVSPILVCFLSFSVRPPPLPPPPRAGIESLFIGPRERGLFIVVHGEQGSVGLAGKARLARCGAFDFSSSRCVGFRVLCGARGSQDLMKKEEENCLPFPAARLG